ncbi:hypothetical protein F5Y06DRAFT_89934 [Hypoxylon sp. FL0890]|nr:hypothetical protein F5Y06DRAFT_89934 [Hypoxylon sp. FL0890]
MMDCLDPCEGKAQVKAKVKAKPSKYFPPFDALCLDTMKSNVDALKRIAECRVKVLALQGISAIQLWSDAHAAQDEDNATDPYQQYLMGVRKAAGRLIAEELQGQQTKRTQQTPSMTAEAGSMTAEADSMTAQPPKAVSPNVGTPTQGKLNPEAKPFFPSAMDSTQTLHQDETRLAASGLAGFEEFCKKHGLRVSSAKKE